MQASKENLLSRNYRFAYGINFNHRYQLCLYYGVEVEVPEKLLRL